VGSRRRLQEQIAEIRKRNPSALLAWLNTGPRNPACYRASCQTDGGIAPDDAARPAALALKWLARHGLLTTHGADTLRAATRNPAGIELTRPMVTPRGADFLDRAPLRATSTNSLAVNRLAKLGRKRIVQKELPPGKNIKQRLCYFHANWVSCKVTFEPEGSASGRDATTLHVTVQWWERGVSAVHLRMLRTERINAEAVERVQSEALGSLGMGARSPPRLDATQ
jgi:hypothetical protein